MARDRARILPGFSKAQSDIILDPAPIKQVIAAAGSGKTRTVVGLIAYRLRAGLEAPGGVLALSFSRKAAAELRQRLPADVQSQAEVCTFHSFCYRRLRELAPQRVVGRALITEQERRDFLFERMREHAAQLDGMPFAALIDDPALFRRLHPHVALDVFRSFYCWKRAEERMEYEDLQQGLLSLLRRGGQEAEQLRRRYQLVIVDEFQDTDARQLEFLSLLRPARLVVVGDDWQSIYAFRGANLSSFLDFRKLFRGARLFRLADNFRSLRGVVHLGSAVIRGSSRQLRKRVRAVRGGARGLGPLALPVARGRERELAGLFHRFVEARLLVRTNYRRARWIQAGLDPERVLTVHKAKGLEFPAVFLDLVSGWSGAGRTGAEQALQADEEFRILYVAITRAENLVVVLHQPEYGENEREGFYWERWIGPHCRAADGLAVERALRREEQLRGAIQS